MLKDIKKSPGKPRQCINEQPESWKPVCADRLAPKKGLLDCFSPFRQIDFFAPCQTVNANTRGGKNSCGDK